MPEFFGPVVDLPYIFNAPIAAVIEADVMAARAFVEFIEEYGFVRKPGDRPGGATPDFGELRMVSFCYQQPGANGVMEKRLLQIPVLSLIPLPLLEVKTATFDFGVRVLAAERKYPTGGPIRLAGEDTVPPGEEPKFHWPAVLARGSTVAGEETKEDVSPHLEANIRAQIAVGQAGIPAGISNLLGLIGVNALVSTRTILVNPDVISLAPGQVSADLGLQTVPAMEAEIRVFYPTGQGLVLERDDQVMPSGAITRADHTGQVKLRVVRREPIPEPPPPVAIVFTANLDKTSVTASCTVGFGLLRGRI
jgi:hypothetical protein